MVEEVFTSFRALLQLSLLLHVVRDVVVVGLGEFMFISTWNEGI